MPVAVVMVTSCHRGGDQRTMATLLVFVLAVLACTGECCLPFMVY